MQGISDKECVFKYDKQGNLVEYVEYQDQAIKHAYHFQDNTLKKVYHNRQDDDEIYREMKSVTTFPDGGVLHHQFFDGDSRVVVRKPNGDYLAPLKKMEMSDGNYTGYSIKPELIQKWIT
ncbi:MAG: hypothetical protein P8J32_00190 [bacterium]|nr:hypothetical protein [bacterium]